MSTRSFIIVLTVNPLVSKGMSRKQQQPSSRVVTRSVKCILRIPHPIVTYSIRSFADKELASSTKISEEDQPEERQTREETFKNIERRASEQAKEEMEQMELESVGSDHEADTSAETVRAIGVVTPPPGTSGTHTSTPGPGAVTEPEIHLRLPESGELDRSDDITDRTLSPNPNSRTDRMMKITK